MTATRKQDPPGVLPESALPCIWMTAGLVAYKLCDRGLECDGCPFDEAIRGSAASAQAAADAEDATQWRFPDDRRYHPAHTWVLDTAHGKSRVGLDAFAAKLLSCATAVVFPPAGSRLHQGRAAAWISDGTELVPVRAPVSGIVLRHNPELRVHPRLLGSRPYDDGWLMEIETSATARESRALLSADLIGRRVRGELEKLRGTVLRCVEGERKEVGRTLPDGGQPLNDLRRLVGPRAYRRIVESLLG